MSNKPLPKTAEEHHRQVTRDWLANCALEGIYPDAETLAEFELVDSGKLSAEEYLTYLKAQYPAKTEVK